MCPLVVPLVTKFANRDPLIRELRVRVPELRFRTKSVFLMEFRYRIRVGADCGENGQRFKLYPGPRLLQWEGPTCRERPNGI